MKAYPNPNPNPNRNRNRCRMKDRLRVGFRLRAKFTPHKKSRGAIQVR